MLYFCVQDTGIGISQNDLPRLFSAFVQSDASITRAFGGMRLCLHLFARRYHDRSAQLVLQWPYRAVPSYWRNHHTHTTYGTFRLIRLQP